MPFGGGKDRIITQRDILAVLLTTIQTTIFTAPAGKRTEVTFANVAVKEDNVTNLWLVPYGESVEDKYHIWWDVKFLKEKSYQLPLPYILNPGDYFVAQTEKNYEVALRIEGRDASL